MSRQFTLRAIGALISLFRRIVHIVLPHGSSPAIYQSAMSALLRMFVYDSASNSVLVRQGPLMGMRKIGPYHPRDFAFATGSFERSETRAIIQHCRPGMVAVDVGANAGYHTMLLSKLVGVEGRVFSFEPVAESALWLRRTVQANGLTNVTIYEKALSSEETISTIKYQDVFDGYAHLVDGGHGYYNDIDANTARVHVQTLDGVLAQVGLEHVDIIKIDIEGSELLALAGMAHTISNCHPTLIVEFWGIGNIAEGYSLLNDWGYQVNTLSQWSGIVHGRSVRQETVLALHT